MLPAHIEWIRKGLSKEGKTQSGLAAHLGLAHPAVTNLLKGTRNLKVDEIPKIAEYLEEPLPPWIYTPVKGKVSAGPDGEVIFADGDATFGHVPPPPGSSLSAVALEVEGMSMRGMADPGSIIFYEEKYSPGSEFFGEVCVCWLEDGRTVVKYLYPGTQSGLFNLESTNAPTMRDVPVREIAPVKSFMTRREAQKWLNANPEHYVQDVVA